MILYAIAGWIVIEVASTVLPGLNLPEWTSTLVIVLVALGFPVAILMAWAFDIGPEGVTRTAPAADPGSNEKSAEPEQKAGPTASEARTRARGDGHSIAVLPFVNMSGDPQNVYFSDGIAEEILNLLVKIPQLKVASRTSSFVFKGKEVNIPTVARELDVSTVLEGSVRQAGGRVRITAQLIETETDTHLWSETYDREFKDVFAIQDDIAQSIVDALQVTLSPKERRAIQSVATSDAQAYDFYLRGRSYMHPMTRRDYEHAIGMYEKAIGIDPKYALAYAGIADAYSHLYRYADASHENAEKALEFSDRAIEMDPDSSEARASRGLALFINEQYEEAEKEFALAIDLNPRLFEAYYYSGLAYTSQGQFERAVEMYLKAQEVSSTDYQPVIFLAQAYASLGRKHDEMKARLASIELIERHVQMNPHDSRALCVGANQFCNIGEMDRGMKWAEEARRRAEDEPLVLYNLACFYSQQGQEDHALDLLDRAVERGWGDRAWVETDSDLDPLRDEPRFKMLLEKLR